MLQHLEPLRDVRAVIIETDEELVARVGEHAGGGDFECPRRQGQSSAYDQKWDAKARLSLIIESADPQRLVELAELCRRQRADALDQVRGRDCDQPGARDKATPSDRDANDARGRKALVNADVYLDGQAVRFVTGGFDDEHRPDLVRVVPEDYDGATLVGLNTPDLTSLNRRDFVFVHSKIIPLSRGATPR